ncbi:MAG: phosphoenolpyruvate synthase [Oscillospiraceae bacterium]|nr:phosphoenolpyruvate synthase [Oscillospiraceae bacterium]
MKYIYSFKEISGEDRARFGGKGASLARLTKMGLPVPEGYVIDASAFDRGEIIKAAAEELKRLISQLSPEHTYAVRSSALSEDGENASFAGAYETVTDVKRDNIFSAAKQVAMSADSVRVKQYAESSGAANNGIAVVIQRFVRPEFAGVVFTADPISGNGGVMTGNYVRGEGEALVSGEKNAEEFSFNAMRYAYSGNKEFEKYAKRLYKFCSLIRDGYRRPMDIEWAVSKGKVYILQARPITSLKRIDRDSFTVNGSLAGEYLLSKTNVGEIFMRPVSPMTYSVLEIICETMGMPCFIDNVCGQPYANLSVICSLMVAMGVPEKTVFEKIKDIAGELPQGITVPLFPFDDKNFRRRMRKLFFSGSKNKMSGREKREFSEKMGDIADGLIAEIRQLPDNSSLYDFWATKGTGFLSSALGAIIRGVNIFPLFGTKKKLADICGEELANELCSGGAGVLDSMKPLLLLEDVINGGLSKEEYIKLCGHRSVNEMELSAPYPYESPDFPDNLIEEHKKSGANIHKMREEQENRFKASVNKFKELYPNKAKWLDRTLHSFKEANRGREEVRSKGVRLFCMMREFLLRAGELNGIGEDIFLLYFSEAMELLQGDKSALENIPKRRESYERYLSYPPFPNLVYGRFDPEKWLSEDNPRHDFYSERVTDCPVSADIKGFPGAAGTVTARVRVIFTADCAEELMEGEILVAPATNIGWTVVFPRAAAIITDIGAPLSHAAIVAREFGIPAVVGCGNATTVLKTGDIVTVDGAGGIVTVQKG